MVKSLTAFTEEIDDPKKAISDILDKIDFSHDLLKNSVGIVHCFNEYAENGIVEELSSKLPFEIVGCTTISASACGIMSEIALILTVLTSDDVEFAVGASVPVEQDAEKPVKELYNNILSKLGEKPSLLITFIPFTNKISGNEFLVKLNECAGNIPSFGTVAVSNNSSFEDSYTICNGKAYPESLVLLALKGDVSPSFATIAVMGDMIVKQKALVTSSEQNIVKTINGVTAYKYLKAAGVVDDEDVSGLLAMPFILELENGSQLVRTVTGLTPEGYVLFAGFVPVNSRFNVYLMESDDVLQSTEVKVSEVLENSSGKTIMMYSCVGRNWALGINAMAEHEKIREIIENKATFYCVYSGGEVFPSKSTDESITNYMQNNSLVICVI